MGMVQIIAAMDTINLAVIGVGSAGGLLLIVWYLVQSRRRKSGQPVYGDLLRNAIKQTNYSTYFGLSWSTLLLLSGFGSYRASIHPNEPVGLILACYALIAVWIGFILLMVRERLHARRMVLRYMAARSATPVAASS